MAISIDAQKTYFGVVWLCVVFKFSKKIMDESIHGVTMTSFFVYNRITDAILEVYYAAVN